MKRFLLVCLIAISMSGCVAVPALIAAGSAGLMTSPGGMATLTNITRAMDEAVCGTVAGSTLANTNRGGLHCN